MRSFVYFSFFQIPRPTIEKKRAEMIFMLNKNEVIRDMIFTKAVQEQL